MKTIQTSEIPKIQGLYACPECAAAGTRKTTVKLPGMGSHRLSAHGVTGTSTGSNAYKKAHNYKKFGTKKTYIKRTSRGPYNKTTKVNPIIELLSNPAEFAGSLDSLIYEKQAEVARLQSQIDELDKSIVFLRRFQSIANTPATQHFQEVA